MSEMEAIGAFEWSEMRRVHPGLSMENRLMGGGDADAIIQVK